MAAKATAIVIELWWQPKAREFFQLIGKLIRRFKISSLDALE